MLDQKKILIFKLAAIGDVVNACRALTEFLEYNEIAAQFHWIIDKKLETLAKALLPQTIQIQWHPIHSQQLFQGNLFQKINTLLHIFKIALNTRPQFFLILHRHWIYETLFKIFFSSTVLRLSKNPCRELENYRSIFTKLAQILNLNKKPKSIQLKPHKLTQKIGILIGGAQNQKLLYKEKRWPIESQQELISKLLKETNNTVVLFGSSDDRDLEKQICVNYPNSKRIQSYVGKLALEELPQHLENLDVFISIDSGLAQIAAWVMQAPQQKIISLFGPTDPNIWAPVPTQNNQVHVLYKSLSCSPCYKNDGIFLPCIYTGDSFQMCMKKISVDEVFMKLID